LTVDLTSDRVRAPYGGATPGAWQFTDRADFVVIDIEPAPANQAGATVAMTGGYHQRNPPKPIVLVDQGGHWRITQDTAINALDNFYFVAVRPEPPVGAFK
jgi:hypothetical protein